MNFKTHNDTEIDVNGTCLQYRDVQFSRERIVEVFGEPMKGDPGDAWDILFDDGKVATIYDWYGRWNVGGHGLITAYRVIDLLNGNPIQD